MCMAGRYLVDLANSKLRANWARIARFQTAFSEQFLRPLALCSTSFGEHAAAGRRLLSEKELKLLRGRQKAVLGRVVQLQGCLAIKSSFCTASCATGGAVVGHATSAGPGCDDVLRVGDTAGDMTTGSTSADLAWQPVKLQVLPGCRSDMRMPELVSISLLHCVLTVMLVFCIRLCTSPVTRSVSVLQTTGHLS